MVRYILEQEKNYLFLWYQKRFHFSVAVCFSLVYMPPPILLSQKKTFKWFMLKHLYVARCDA